MNTEKKFRVLVVGSPNCGKSALITQFWSLLELQHNGHSADTPHSPLHNGDNQCSVLKFKEIISLDNCFPKSPITIYQPDAYIVVYSINDRESFNGAKQIINEIQKWDDFELKPVILVANKTDLVRSRTITDKEGRQLATSNNCKYIETSCAISHNIDLLLAGIWTQISLKSNSNQGHILSRKPSLFKRLLRKATINKSKSCDNFHTL